MIAVPNLSTRLLEWFDRHGRRDLPWQRDASPYRVWISEIMLQQTQVQAVIPYFERFIERFPDAAALADAPTDEVLHLWSGLGYYARARNMQRAAHMVVNEHGGHFPEDLETLMALPGIGRSTAGAILALSKGQRHPILDGNVKRVLCRYHALEGWPGSSSVEQRLWTLADAHTPAERVGEYTQAIMDLGATVCTRTRPDCEDCPLESDCLAHAEGREIELPHRKPRKMPPLRRTVFVMVRDDDGRVLLERRPPSGVWGGLWSFPECVPDTDVREWCRTRLGLEPARVQPLGNLRHTFSHFRLDIEPVLVEVQGSVEGKSVADDPERLWYEPTEGATIGLAAPVTRLLRKVGGLVD